MKAIEEASREYADSMCRIDSNIDGVCAKDVNESLVNAFNEGVKFAQRWIPIEDKLPQFKVKVLLKYKDNEVILDSISFDIRILQDNDITHWRPIEIE